MGVSLNYCSQNGGKLYRAPYYNGNPNIGPRIVGNLDQSPYMSCIGIMAKKLETTVVYRGHIGNNGKENGNYYI